MIDIGRVEKLESCLPDNLQAIDLMAKNIVGGTLSACSIELGGAKMGFLSFASQGEWNTDGLLITVACLTPEFLLAGGKSIDNRELILRLQQLPIFGSEEARESARKAAKLDPDEILKHEHLLRLLDPSPYVLSQEEILEMIENEIEQAVIFHTAADSSAEWNINEIYQVMSTVLPVEQKLKEELAGLVKDGDKLDKVKVRTKICDHLMALVKTNYEKITKLAGEAGINWRQVEKAVLIRSFDMLWMEHLEAMDYLRSSVNLRAYGQREPIVEYKKEGLFMFKEMEKAFKEQVFSLIQTINVEIQPKMEESSPKQTLVTSHNEPNEFSDTKKLAEKKSNIGRNDPCPCSSGRKYKKCHGA